MQDNKYIYSIKCIFCSKECNTNEELIIKTFIQEHNCENIKKLNKFNYMCNHCEAKAEFNFTIGSVINVIQTIIEYFTSFHCNYMKKNSILLNEEFQNEEDIKQLKNDYLVN